MTLCSRCRRRKAKRHCPALGAALCSLCCGQARNKEVRCPDSCPVLAEHRPYEERRSVERNDSSPAPWAAAPDILRDERLAWLAAHIEFPIGVYGQGRADLTDADAVLALEYAREKLRGAGRVLVLPGESLKPRNELGEAILQSAASCRDEGTLIVPGADSAYTIEEKERVIDRVLQIARDLARSQPGGRGFIDRLIEHFARVDQRSRSQATKARRPQK